MTGRPSDYSDETAAAICARMADGESLRSVCRDDEMPGLATVFRWLGKHEAFREQYAKAVEARAEKLADEIVDIADDGSNDWMERNDPDNPGYKENGEAIARSRLRVDARKWVASKLLPRKYGERVTQEISGPNGGPIQTENLSNRERAKALLAVLQKAGGE